MGLVIGMSCIASGFAVVWHIWWLAALGVLCVLAGVVYRSFDDKVTYTLAAAEVEKTDAHHAI